jgi:hypothetical protein
MAIPIVTINVSTQLAPTPPTLQKTGAIVSCGGTVLAANRFTLLTQLSDLTPFLPVPAAVTSAVLSTGTVTVTTTVAHGIPTGTVFIGSLAGFTPTAYNVTQVQMTVTGASTFTFALGGSPGAVSIEGTWINNAYVGVLKAATTFFAQGWNQGIYVLETGVTGIDPTATTNEITALSNYIIANPNSNYTPGAVGFFYIYALPKHWDNTYSATTNAALAALFALYESNTALTYFWATTTLDTYVNYTPQMKDVLALIESPVFGTYSAASLTVLAFTAVGSDNVPPGYATATFSATPAGISAGMWVQFQGQLPSGYSGWHNVLLTNSTTIEYPLTTNPGAESALGTLVANSYSSSGVGLNEFSIMATLWTVLNFNPSSTNRITPFNYSEVFGVTPFPSAGTSALTTTIQNAHVNFINTGAEGGIAGTFLWGGTTMDGQDFSNYWYGIDWLQINTNINLANAVINGSNNPINPLYYNQQGINRLQGVIASTVQSGITFGMFQGSIVLTSLDGPDLDAKLDNGDFAGQLVINAIPFPVYAAENPGDYAIGVYKGFSGIIVPQLGFNHIQVNFLVTELIALA